MEKMTHKEIYTHIAEVMADEPMVVEFCGKMIAQLDKPRKPKTNPEAAEFAEKVWAYLDEQGEAYSNADLKAVFEVSAQKMAAALRRLVNEDRVIRVEDGKNVTFVVA